MLDLLSRAARPWALAGLGLAVLLGLQAAGGALERRARTVGAAAELAEQRSEEAGDALAEAEGQRAARLKQLASFKRGLPKLADDRRQVYEDGLALQEEKRLLEKQLEIMTTYLLIDPEAREVRLMRGEQALETYPTGSDAPRAYGGAGSAASLQPVVSKERFAHPERPKSEQVNGQLQWEPPQVGTSLRANALGEFVLFTRGSLILHGPPRRKAEHEAYPHVCLQLSLPVARKLYSRTYIGTRIMLKAAAAAVAVKGKAKR